MQVYKLNVFTLSNTGNVKSDQYFTTEEKAIAKIDERIDLCVEAVPNSHIDRFYRGAVVHMSDQECSATHCFQVTEHNVF